MNTILRGIILGLSITAPIGPTNIEIIRRGTRDGWRAATMFCLGVMVALVIYLTLVTMGLSFIMQSVIVNLLLTIIGVFVLAFLAYNGIKDFFTGVEYTLGNQRESHAHFVPGILLTIANPSIILLWTGIMGADLTAHHASLIQGLQLSFGVLIGVAIFFTVFIVLIHSSRKIIEQKNFRYVSLAAGVVLLVFCIKFTWDLLMRFI